VSQSAPEAGTEAAPRRRFTLRRAITVLLIGATAYYLYVSVARNLEDLRRFPWAVAPLRLVASVVSHVLVLAAGVWVWGRVLDHFAHPPVRTGTLMRIWFVSNLARYIPGKIFQFVVAGQLATSAGLTGSVLLTSLVMHTGFSLLAATVVSAWTLIGPTFPGVPAAPLAAGITLLCIAAVHPRLLNGVLGLAPRLLRKEVIRWNGTWLQGVVLVGYSVVTWAAYGVAYWLLIAALTPVPASSIGLLTGINAGSFLLGYVALTPAGIGPREFVMTNLLIPLVGGPGVGAVLAVASRLWTAVAEVVGGAAVLALTGGAASVDNRERP